MSLVFSDFFSVCLYDLVCLFSVSHSFFAVKFVEICKLGSRHNIFRLNHKLSLVFFVAEKRVE
jgi:hypothetical protein